MRHPHLPEALSEALIQQLVQTFYARIRQDLILGPIFESRVGHRWDEHLANMVDFWSSVTMMSGRYHGKPHVAHQTLGLTPDHFKRWLALFEACVSEICAGHAAAFFVDRAHRIADSLQIGLNIGPDALHLPARKETSDASA
ncbi:MAG: hemoglobin [Hyphomicrobiales bacterium]|nr:hemoglobin [Hyphomicrobiales bacterium]